MARFGEAPEDASRVITPTGRSDEIGEAEQRLVTMQKTLGQTLNQQRRLADLGLAVSKINHNLRNLFASAQLFLERLETSSDPLAARLAPKIVSTLDRAVGYTSAVFAYGRAQEVPPWRRLVHLSRIVDDVGLVLGFVEHGSITWENGVARGMEIDADPEQIFRVLMNICRNAVQALQGEYNPAVVKRLSIAADRTDSLVTIRITDTGSGVPPAAKVNLFRAFQSSVRPGGTGLGLAIAAELIRAHGGEIALEEERPGACFRIMLPDRSRDLSTQGSARNGVHKAGQNGATPVDEGAQRTERG
ncbi:HAMP domain-containing sensor histidine kinase [Breoghania sp.]|uniref:HAMP domain-containing sensor histidine kinase n=1 Tax=Breoghania sp. TaxID=2065378 RepID=UPI002611F33D|nr:HAMP domain-containing sensor histidine kinase [Breoghania sp.]MDJ0930015.1 HAMP domain-containing sensor histidine kinase [Breoghania sp.]